MGKEGENNGEKAEHRAHPLTEQPEFMGARTIGFACAPPFPPSVPTYQSFKVKAHSNQQR